MAETPRLVIPFGQCRWELWSDTLVKTVFWDGKGIEAAPVHQRDCETARRYGYGEDTARLCRHHDLFHSMIAINGLGRPYSRTLRYVATGGREYAEGWFRAAEEWVIFQMQAWVVNDGPVPEIAESFATPEEAARLIARRDEWREWLSGYGLL